MKKYKFSIIFAALISAILLSGCSAGPEEKPEVVIRPFDLFKGDLKAIEPHLGITGSCVKVEYKGDKNRIKCSYEIWKGGNLEDSGGGFWIPVESGYSANVSMSLMGMYLDNMDTSPYMLRTIAIGDDSAGYSSSKGYIDRFDSSYSWGDITLNEAIEGSDDEEYAVWGVVAGKEMRSSGIETAVKESQWGYMVKISFEDE